MLAFAHWYTLIFFTNPVLTLIYHTLIYHNACNDYIDAILTFLATIGPDGGLIANFYSLVECKRLVLNETLFNEVLVAILDLLRHVLG